MNIKTIQSRIQMTDGACQIAILPNDMYRTYLLADMLAEHALSELELYDAASRRKMLLNRSESGKNIVEDYRIHLSDDGIACVKRLISRCYLNPYDMEWMHYDLDAENLDGEETTLCVRLWTEG